MTVKTNAISAKRKELANDIAEWLGTPATYNGAPTFAYQIGDITIDKISEFRTAFEQALAEFFGADKSVDPSKQEDAGKNA